MVIVPSYLETIIKRWKDQPIIHENDIDNKMRNFAVLFAYHSNRIEDERITYHDTRELFINGRVVGFTGDPEILSAIAGQKLCYEYQKSFIVRKQKIERELILNIHRELMNATYDDQRCLKGERPGEFKHHDYVVGIHAIGSEPGYLEEINTTEMNEENFIKISAYFHGRFEQIHPFADGNGRVGRSLMNYLLMINDFPPLIIHDEDKPFYYECLEAFDEKENLEPLILLLQYSMEKTWKNT